MRLEKNDGEGKLLRTDVDQAFDAVLAAARSAGADLIAMSTHGRSGVGRLLFGSAGLVVVMAICSVAGSPKDGLATTVGLLLLSRATCMRSRSRPLVRYAKA